MTFLHNNEEDKLIEQIYEFIEKEAAKEPPRNYIGASSIGEDCEKKLYYKLRHADKAKARRAELILAANDGHRSEDLVASYIRQIPGIELWTYKNDGGQYGFHERFHDVDFKGHVDGIIKGIPQAPATVHIWENKSSNQKIYDAFLKAKEKHGTKGALAAWNPKYYAQAVINMEKFDISRHYMTVCLAGTRKISSCRTEANPQLAKLLTEKAARVASAKTPPFGISENPTFYECKYMCDFYEHCFEGKI